MALVTTDSSNIDDLPSKPLGYGYSGYGGYSAQYRPAFTPALKPAVVSSPDYFRGYTGGSYTLGDYVGGYTSPYSLTYGGLPYYGLNSSFVQFGYNNLNGYYPPSYAAGSFPSLTAGYVPTQPVRRFGRYDYGGWASRYTF
eukprot:TRINITY_DN16962_c0_g1_i1.p1 TRINITY_DN16962_c0_g1~~TRINITY_DN16962_c0_g1_i1.p1  ORF type:complete len:141 (-),score=9.75 TRINITY_DN16962_c0_g1_i1:53-475(-)